MKKYISTPFIILLLGLLFSGIAIFAELVGLDRNPGNWSRIRIAIFVAGIILMFFSSIYSRFSRSFSVAIIRLNSFLHNQKFVIWVLENKKFQYLSKLFREYILDIIIPAVVIVFYIWFVSSGTWTTWKSTTYYYSDLADAFLNGNLHFSVQPDPKLLALENPLIPSARSGIEFPADYSLYNEKFYMYWGPVPALILMAIQFLLQKQIGDLVVTFGFVSGIFLVQSQLLYKIWNQLFQNIPKWILYIFMLLAGLTSPIILLRHNYDLAKIYEAAIAGGQFFLVSGFFMAFIAITKGYLSNWRLAFSGLLWMLAIGTRHVLAAPIGVMAILTIFWILSTRTTITEKIVNVISLGLPMALGVVTLGWYNWARFGSISETGFSYALAGVDLQNHANDIFSRSYIIQNLFNYLLNSPGFTSKFPFISMVKGNNFSILHLNTLPEFYNAQPITGLLYVFPFVVFILIPLFIMLARLFNKALNQNQLNTSKYNLLNWVALNMRGAFFISFCLLMFFFWAGMRYMGDFMPSLIILSILGYWQGYQYVEHYSLAKKMYILVGLFLAISSILTSTLLLISTNSELVNLIIKYFHRIELLGL